LPLLCCAPRNRLQRERCGSIANRMKEEIAR
jgi:hypothetical protein